MYSNINKITVDLEECQTKLMSNFEVYWKKQLIRKPKLRLYKLWKQDQKIPYYLKLHLSRQQRSFLAQLRSGSLPIHIETGRYIGLTVDQRVCKYCTSGSVETEYHFLFECSCYEEIRNYFSV